MKKWIIFIILALLLSSCQLPGIRPNENEPADAGQSESEESLIISPTMSDIEMATRVAQILTSMPTSTMANDSSNAPPTATPTIVTTITTVPSVTVAATSSEGGGAAATPEQTSEPPTVTPTPTPLSTIDPNDFRASLGEPAWVDQLNDGSKWTIDEDSYSIGKIENGSLVFIGKQKLNAWRLAYTQSLTKAYIEATIKTGQCSDSDSYGLMFRVPGFAEANRGYLLGVTCGGNYYLKKWDSANMTALVAETASAEILAGSDQINRIGVLLNNGNFKFFINGVYVGQYTDSTYSSGYFGLFVRPQKTNRFTIYADEVSYWIDVPDVNIEDAPVAPNPESSTPTLQNYTPPVTVVENATVAPTITPTPTGVNSNLESLLVPTVSNPVTSTTIAPINSQTPSPTSDFPSTDPRAKLGPPDWSDKLDHGAYWPIDQDDYSIAKMGQGVLEFTSLTKGVTWRLTRTLPLQNAYRELVIKTNYCPGKNGYGVYFHANGDATKGYYFGITCNGSYFLDKWDITGPVGSQKHTILVDTSNQAILTGNGQTNRIGVLTFGNRLGFYINGTQIIEIPESTFTSGYFGAFIRPDSAEPFTIHIDETSYWVD